MLDIKEINILKENFSPSQIIEVLIDKVYKKEIYEKHHKMFDIVLHGVLTLLKVLFKRYKYKRQDVVRNLI